MWVYQKASTFFWGEGKTPLPNFETPGLSEVYPPLLPAKMATHRVPWAGDEEWCDGIEGMFIPTSPGGISKKVGFMLEPSARPEGCPIHSGNYSWFVKSGIFVKKPDGSSCCKTSHNQMYCKKKSGQTYSNNTELPTSPTLSNLFFMDRWCFIHKPTLAEMAVSKSWVVGRMQISKF